MKLLTEEDIPKIIKKDPWMMHVLTIIRQLNLPDWWIGAGFVRGKVWDFLHDKKERTPLPDIDVIYFDPQEKNPERKEKELSKYLGKQLPNYHFEVINQARTHLWHNDPPYRNSSQALSRWVETATCIGVRLNEKDELELTTPLGIDDLVNLIVRPNPIIPFDKDLFEKRIKEKKWLTLWPKLKVIYS